MTRIAQNDYRREDLADVRFVPLLGEEGWAPEEAEPARARYAPPTGAISEEQLVKKIADAAEPFASIDTVDLGPLLEQIGDARVVLLGEATHGTSEFYRMRERISRELVAKKGFRFIAIEGDWPDAAQGRSLRAASGISARRMDGVRAFPDLDVAQQRGA